MASPPKKVKIAYDNYQAHNPDKAIVSLSMFNKNLIKSGHAYDTSDAVTAIVVANPELIERKRAEKHEFVFTFASQSYSSATLYTYLTQGLDSETTHAVITDNAFHKKLIQYLRIHHHGVNTFDLDTFKNNDGTLLREALVDLLNYETEHHVFYQHAVVVVTDKCQQYLQASEYVESVFAAQHNDKAINWRSIADNIQHARQNQLSLTSGDVFIDDTIIKPRQHISTVLAYYHPNTLYFTSRNRMYDTVVELIQWSNTARGANNPTPFRTFLDRFEALNIQQRTHIVISLRQLVRIIDRR